MEKDIETVSEIKEEGKEVDEKIVGEGKDEKVTDKIEEEKEHQEGKDKKKKKRKRQCVKIAVIGNVDSGKSTLVGVLTKGELDDGRGLTRLKVFNYAHEVENGRTSSIAHEIMGFYKDGTQVVPKRFNPNKNKYWSLITAKADKLLTFIDLCGHEKYLKTTMFGLIGLIPDFAMIIVGANMGISRMTIEHINISLALRIPFFVVLTKIDICPENIFKETMKKLLKLLKNKSFNRKPYVYTSLEQENVKEEIKTCAKNLKSNSICPVFQVSNVTGSGLDVLKMFLSLLKDRSKQNKLIKKPTDPVIFDIHENFLVSGAGLVVSGILKSGTVLQGQELLLGPDKDKTFKKVVVKGIHMLRRQVPEAIAGNFCCLNIRAMTKKDEVTRKTFRKGMSLIDEKIKPEPIWEFEAEILVYKHSSTIKAGYQAVLHCGVVRQAVQILKMENEVMRSKDRGIVRFRFMYNAELIHNELTILLREGETKILGRIKQVFPGKEENEGINIDT